MSGLRGIIKSMAKAVDLAGQSGQICPVYTGSQKAWPGPSTWRAFSYVCIDCPVSAEVPRFIDQVAVFKFNNGLGPPSVRNCRAD